jgi:pectin methylesterase-like acyl-CoA thioesterase
MLVETSDLLTLDTLTLKNTTLRSSAISAQAETIYFNNDAGRLIAKNANFYSEQDTLNLKGYAWFYHSLVAGNVDFIWGSSRAALFEESEIRSVGDTTSSTSGGYILQARVANATDKGYVLLNSSLTHGAGPGPLHGDVPAGATYLARSSGSATVWDNIAFINTKMDSHIATVGWAGAGVNSQPAPNPAVATAASGWREYGSSTLAGDAINLAARVGGFQLSASDVAAGFADRAKVFAAYNGGAGWNPQP